MALKPLTAAGIPWGKPLAKPTFQYSETGAAEVFAAECGDRVRFDHRRQRWLIWQGHRWVPDVDGAIMRLVIEFVRRQQHTAVDITDLFARQQALDHWMKYDRLANQTTLLAIAKNLPPIADAGAMWDPDHLLLGVPNGVIDLQTGSLRPGRPGDRITRSTSVPFDQTAACPRWERFIVDVFDDDRPRIQFVHRALGYSLTGLTNEQVLFLCYGTGQNGKGVLLRTIGTILLDYASTMPSSTIEMTRGGGIPNDVAALDGPRFVMANETNDGCRIDEARVKALTGSDPVTARFLHGEFFTFTPRATFWLASNHLPQVRDDSYGFWRRIRQLPFERTFPMTPGLEEALAAEAPGILSWLVRGCLLWQAEGLCTPDSVVAATDAYRATSDVLGDFIREACELEDSAQVGAADLFQHYIVWAMKSGLSERERLTSTKFGTKVSARFKRVHSKHGKVYHGVARRGL